MRVIPVNECEPRRAFTSHLPPQPGAYKKLEDDAGVWVVVFKVNSARLLQVHGVHQRGRALIRVGGDIVTQRNPLGPVREQEPSSQSGAQPTRACAICRSHVLLGLCRIPDL